MMLDDQQGRLWAAHGSAWSDFAAGSLSLLATGVKTMIERNWEHLRHLAVTIAALVVSAAFVGVAVAPALPG